MYLLYTLLWFLVYFNINKKNNLDTNYNSYIVAFIHATLSIFLNGLNYFCIDRFNDWDSSYNILSNQAICVSLGYFIYDLYHTTIKNYNKIFTIHHLLSITTLLFSYNTQTCSKLVSTFLLYGEISNPLQIIWYLSDKFGYNTLEKMVFPIYSLLFISIRTIIIPYLIFDIIKKLYHNYYILIYCTFYTIGLIGSYKWTQKMIIKSKNRYFKL